ncbi:MAG: hypothetical protein KIG70_01140 [Treponema sp.]|uniref:hypothetical protein n=1 Tax=Treponema sp. TaxID=166 RepID=UPI001DA49A58|nr:hypothetical protein [Treponema sp.]MBS7309774.1 hypothetical protein [Treponema sp.]MCI5696789.1 hypothetical protein [Spirochaetia bacterium]MDD5812048.1 hypothetical protein [Treponema sp.]MDY5886301.1 hypothetical protein [Treponema sp.]
MVAIILGILFIAFTVFSVLPASAGFGLHWGADVINFLKGCAPVLAAFIGFVAILIGAADIKDKNEAKKEEQEAEKNQEK